MDQTDVNSKYIAATGLLGVGGAGASPRVRIKAIWMATPVTAGSITITDGSATGSVRIKMDTAAAITNDYVWLPGEGVLFQADPYVTLTNITSATIFYG